MVIPVISTQFSIFFSRRKKCISSLLFLFTFFYFLVLITCFSVFFLTPVPTSLAVSRYFLDSFCTPPPLLIPRSRFFVALFRCNYNSCCTRDMTCVLSDVVPTLLLNPGSFLRYILFPTKDEFLFGGVFAGSWMR